jgi:alpha-glucosidase
MNNGMFDLRQGNTTRVDENQPVPSTVVSEAARTLITFSGATIIPDIPEFYKKYPDLLRFLSEEKMPWKESKTLDGKIGEYIVMMRQNQNNTFLVGAVTNEEARTLTIPLSFLPKGNYELTLVQDANDSHYLTNRESYSVDKKQVSKSETITVSLAPGGGACLLLKKNKEGRK